MTHVPPSITVPAPHCGGGEGDGGGGEGEGGGGEGDGDSGEGEGGGGEGEGGGSGGDGRGGGGEGDGEGLVHERAGSRTNVAPFCVHLFVRVEPMSNVW